MYGQEGAPQSHPVRHYARNSGSVCLVFLSMKWAQKGPFHREAQRLNELTHIQRLEECLANSVPQMLANAI